MSHQPVVHYPDGWVRARCRSGRKGGPTPHLSRSVDDVTCPKCQAALLGRPLCTFPDYADDCHCLFGALPDERCPIHRLGHSSQAAFPDPQQAK